MAVQASAATTTLSGWRMCQTMRAASQAGLSPLSTTSCNIPASNAASAIRAGSRRYGYTTSSIARARVRRPAGRSGEGVKHLLNVLVLLQTVDHREDLGRLLLRQLARHGADVLMLGRQRCEAARFQRLLQPAEIGEGTADHQLRLALLAGALAHLLESVVDEVQLEIVLVDPPQHGVGRRVDAAGLHRHGDVLRDAGELLRHAVPPREHRVLSDFEDASHGPAWCTNGNRRASRSRPASLIQSMVGR